MFEEETAILFRFDKEKRMDINIFKYLKLS